MSSGDTAHGFLDDVPSEALLMLAHLYLCHHKEEKAILLFEALREVRPNDPEVLRPLCRSLLLAGRYAEALSVSDEMREYSLDAALQKEETEDPLFSERNVICEARLRAEALWGLGYTEEARQLLEKLLILS